jgi:hypothetical protein
MLRWITLGNNPSIVPLDVFDLRRAIWIGDAGMGFCPICKTSADLEQSGGGDYPN